MRKMVKYWNSKLSDYEFVVEMERNGDIVYIEHDDGEREWVSRLDISSVQ